MKFFLQRLREPSSAASVAALVTAVPHALAGDPLAIGSVIAGLIGFFVPESKPS